MNRDELPTVLCVDDEERVLEGLVLHLRKGYRVHTALSGELALKKLQEIGGAAVVVSDMRMPKMDGAALLHQVMLHYPDTSRILLTGEASRDSVVSAVNEGQIFRFLIKPCAPDRLKAAIDAGIRQHRLASSERVLLQETLMGSIRALVDVLSMTNPHAFGRASRLKRLAMEIAEALGHPQFWELEARLRIAAGRSGREVI
jgi:DNA-binding NtrC family response regulator